MRPDLTCLISTNMNYMYSETAMSCELRLETRTPPSCTNRLKRLRTASRELHQGMMSKCQSMALRFSMV